jgi:hypothetical protein
MSTLEVLISSADPITAAVPSSAAPTAARQPLNDNLTALAGLTGTADTVPYFTGAGAMALAPLTAYGRSVIAAASAAAARTVLGLAALASTASAADITAGLLAPARGGTGADLSAATAGRLPEFAAAGVMTQSAIADGFTGGVATLGGALGANRSYVFPDANITVAGSASALTSGRVPIVAAGGLLTDSAAFLFNAADTVFGLSANTIRIGSGGASNNHAILNAAAGQITYFVCQRAGNPRWRFGADATAESGSDAGTQMVVTAYTDAGASIDNPISIVRASGGSITLARPTAVSYANAQLTVGSGSGSSTITLNGQAGGNRDILIQSNGSLRWVIRTDTTAESGSNAGSNLFIRAYTDAGALIDNAMSIVRAAGGVINMGRPVTINSVTAATATATGALVCNGDINISRATGSATLTPATLRLESTAAASDFSTTANWANLDFYSADTSGPGASVRARIGARMENALGSAVSLVFQPSGSGGLGGTMILDSNGTLTVAGSINTAGNVAISTGAGGVFGWTYTPNDTTSKIVLAMSRGSGVTPAYINSLSTGANDVSGVRFDVGGVVSATFTANGITVRDGTPGAPGLRLTSEASGLYRVSATSLGFAVAGVGVAQFAAGVYTFGDGASASTVTVSASTSTTPELRFSRGGNSRWRLFVSGTESGSNAGAALTLRAADDAGATIDDPINVVRAAGGAMTLTRPTSISRVTATTASPDICLTVANNSSGTPATGYGSTVAWNLKSSTTNDRAAAQINCTWVDAADATRKARVALFTYDTAVRENIRIEASGTAPLIGFLGAAAVARQAVGAAATDPATTQTLANNIRTALINLGLCQN